MDSQRLCMGIAVYVGTGVDLMKIYIISNNDSFHCASDEQHIEKIFLHKTDAEKYKEILEQIGRDSYDLLEWEVVE